MNYKTYLRIPVNGPESYRWLHLVKTAVQTLLESRGYSHVNQWLIRDELTYHSGRRTKHYIAYLAKRKPSQHVLDIVEAAVLGYLIGIETN